MIALAGILGSALLAGSTASAIAPDIHGDEAQRASFNTVNSTSDDPRNFFLGQPNPRHLRHLTMDDVRGRDNQILYKGLPDLKARQTGRAGGVLRDMYLDEQTTKAFRELRWEAYNRDLPMTGWNGSNNNYHIRWARSIPPGNQAIIGGYNGAVDTLEDTVGTKSPVDHSRGVYHEDRFIYSHGTADHGTGVYHDANGKPHFPHLFKTT